MAQIVNGKLAGRMQVHTSPVPGTRRKRVQPKGSRECMGCGKKISANKSHCAGCTPEGVNQL